MFAYIDKIIEGYNNADRETEIGQYYIIFNASKELTKKSETMKKYIQMENSMVFLFLYYR